MKKCSLKRTLCMVFAFACLLTVTAVPVMPANAATTVAGDADGSGTVNTGDVVYLLYHTIYPGTYPIKGGNCDFDSDGIVNSDDVIYLMYHTIFGTAEYPLGSTVKTGLTINGTDLSNFRIVRPHFNSSYLTQIEMENMVEDIYTSTGYRLQIVEDSYTDENAYEIIVGNADRSGVKKVTADDTYTITIAGTKVYLNGDTPHATAMAVSEFAKMLKKGNVTNAQSMSGNYSTAIKSYDASTHYTYKWGDDFDTATIDTTKWRVYGENEFGREGWNGKWTAMTDDPNYVFNMGSNLYILGHETDTTYYGASLSTSKTMTYQYGYVEKSCIVPDGNGFWSLLWFVGGKGGTNTLYNPEIDLNECFGKAEGTNANVHGWPTSAGSAAGYKHTALDGISKYNARHYTCPDGGKFSDTYHTYGLLWDENHYDFIADGKVFFTYTFDLDNRPEDEGNINAYMHLILSFSVGRLNNGLGITDDPYEWNNTNRFVCDYVNLYQLDNGKGGLNLYK